MNFRVPSSVLATTSRFFRFSDLFCPVDEDLGEVDARLTVNVARCTSELLVDASFLAREVLVELYRLFLSAPFFNYVLAESQRLHEVTSFCERQEGVGCWLFGT